MPSAAKRVRNKPLPKFEPGFSFEVPNARIDRMKVEIRLGVARTENLEIIQSLFRTISRGSDVLRNDGTSLRPKLRVRKGRSGEDLWLFGGEILAKPRLGQGISDIVAEIDLNAIRYFAHHPSSRPRDRTRGGELSKELLRPHALSRATLKGITLDGSDNYILNERMIEAARLDWYSYTTDIIKRIVAVLKYEMKLYDRLDLLYFHDLHRKWTIKQIEINWEYVSTYAPGAVEDMAVRAKGYFGKRKLTPHINSIEEARNSVSFTFGLTRKGMSGLVYAKSLDRIRIECKFNRPPKKIYPGDARYSLQTYPQENFEALEGILTAICRAAKAELAPLTDCWRSYTPTSPPAPQRLANELIAMSGTSKYKAFILSGLLHALFTTGKITENDDPTYNKLLSNLKQQAYLKQTTRKSRGMPKEYSITGEMRRAFEWLSTRRNNNRA